MDAAEAPADDLLTLGDRTFRSRLILGTGKYRSLDEMALCHAAAETEMVTVAVRRVDLADRSAGSLLARIDRSRVALLPNTAGCFTADDALRTARLGREAGLTEWVKLEVLGDPRTLLPDPVETLRAAEILVREGFRVLAYTSDDPIIARKLEDAGVTSVMPAGSPIGSGQGILNPCALRILLESVSVPVIVDAGMGTASDVAVAFELGADGVLMNTGIAGAQNPVLMACAMRDAARAGRAAFRAGRIPRKLYGSASSPLHGLIEQASRPGSSGAERGA